MPDSPALAPDHRGPFQVQVPDHDRMPGREPKPSCRANPHLKSSDACARAQVFDSRHPTPDLTGRWEDDQGRFNLFVNHVGTHLECLLALTCHGRHPKVRPDRHGRMVDERWDELCARMFADQDPGAAELLTLDARDRHGNPMFPDGAGQLHVMDASLLMLTLYADGLPEELLALDGAVCTRVDDLPSLLEGHLGPAQAPDLPVRLRTAHWFPLTSLQVDFLSTLVVTHRAELRTERGRRRASLAEMIEEFFAVVGRLSGDEQRRTRQRVAESIDGLIAEVFGRAQTTPPTGGGIHECQQDFHRSTVQRVLTRTTLALRHDEADVEHSLLTWLGAILDRTPDELNLVAIPEHLGLRSAYGIVYEARLDLRAVEGGLGGLARELSRYLRGLPLSAALYQGTITIRATGARAWGPLTYDVVLAFVGATVGKGAPSRIVTTGSTRPTSSRRPEELEGICFMEDLSVGASVGGGASFGGAVLTMGPTGRALGFEFVGSSDLRGLAIGGQLAIHLGMARLRPSPTAKAELAPTWEIPRVSYRGEIDRLRQNHYSINNALLMPDAMAMLDEVMATELVVLSDPETTVEIEGFADRSGPEDFNESLSRHRALNVQRFIASSSSRIAATITTMARGERPSTDDDGTNDARFRRVDIAISGTIDVGLEGIH